jgi:hypothetical protein
VLKSTRRAFIKWLLVFLSSFPFFWRSRPRIPPALEGWTEVNVDCYNKAGKAMGVLLSKDIEKGVHFSKEFNKWVGDQDSGKKPYEIASFEEFKIS